MIDNVLSVTLTNKKATVTEVVDFVEGCVGSSKINIDLRDEGKRPTLNLDTDEFTLCCLGEKEASVTIKVPKDSFTLSDDNLLVCTLTEELLSKSDNYKCHLEWVNNGSKCIFPEFSFKILDTFCDN